MTMGEDRDDDTPAGDPVAELLAEAVAALPPDATHGLGRDQMQSLALQVEIALSLRDLVTAVSELTDQLRASMQARA